MSQEDGHLLTEAFASVSSSEWLFLTALWYAVEIYKLPRSIPSLWMLPITSLFLKLSTSLTSNTVESFYLCLLESHNLCVPALCDRLIPLLHSICMTMSQIIYPFFDQWAFGLLTVFWPLLIVWL